MFLFKGLVRESIMVICEFYESDFVCVWGGGEVLVFDFRLGLLLCSGCAGAYE